MLWPRWCLALGAVMGVSSCQVVLGIDGAVSGYDDLSFCSCPQLELQDNLLPTSEKFTARCDAAIDLATKPQFDDFIAQDCNVCPVTLSELGTCYATLTGAAGVGEPCTAHADCRSMVCCATGVAGVFQDSGTCCDECSGCLSLGGVGEPSEVCVDLPQRLATESCSNMCEEICDTSKTLGGLRNCALCLNDNCSDSCSRWKDRPIEDAPDN